MDISFGSLFARTSVLRIYFDDFLSLYLHRHFENNWYCPDSAFSCEYYDKIIKILCSTGVRFFSLRVATEWAHVIASYIYSQSNAESLCSRARWLRILLFAVNEKRWTSKGARRKGLGQKKHLRSKAQEFELQSTLKIERLTSKLEAT